jgi:hypothetical protein
MELVMFEVNGVYVTELLAETVSLNPQPNIYLPHGGATPLFPEPCISQSKLTFADLFPDKEGSLEKVPLINSLGYWSMEGAKVQFFMRIMSVLLHAILLPSELSTFPASWVADTLWVVI